jgi:predicted metal-dependent HD superfamily phosphohydrolase
VTGDKQLIDRWMVLTEALEISVGRDECLAAGWEVVGMYASDPGRTYHNIGHLAACLGEFELVRELADDPGAVAAALWFHDAVYVPGAGDNEVRSAELAVDVLGRLGMGRDQLRRVASLINATSHQGPPDSDDEKLICDIDLAVLGKPWSEYSRYAAAVMGEYSIPAEQLAAGRRAFLRTMLGRGHIYHTERFRRRLESVARKNMRRELTELAE